MAARQVQPMANPYAGGAVVFDFSPIANYLLRQDAERKARKEAGEKFFQDQFSKITPAGVDAEDAKTLALMKDQWAKNFIKNKDRIAQGGNEEYMNHMAGFNNMVSFIEEAKQKTALFNDGAKVFNTNNPNYSPDEFVEKSSIIEAAKKPLIVPIKRPDGAYSFERNPEYRPLNLTSLAATPTLSVQDLFKNVDLYKKGFEYDQQKTEIKPNKSNPLHDDVEIVRGYSPQRLTEMAANAAFDYQRDRRLQSTFNNLNTVKKILTPEQFDLMTQRFREITGNPNAEIESGQDAYTAFVISKAGEPKREKLQTVTKTRKAELAEQAQKVRNIFTSAKASAMYRDKGQSSNMVDYLALNDGKTTEGYEIKGGVVYKDGVLFSGNVNIDNQFVQPGLDDVVKEIRGSDDTIQQDGNVVNFKVENGVPVSVKTQMNYEIKRTTPIPKRKQSEGVRPISGGAAGKPPKQNQPPKSETNWSKYKR